MKKKLFLKIGLFLLAIVAIGWDLSTSLNSNVVEGTYRYEADFDAVTGATTKVGIVTSENSELSSPASRDSEITYAQVKDMVTKAIEYQGGLSYVISKGDKVMIKINLVEKDSPSGDGENTDVRVVKALIQIIDEYTEGDVEIVVAEGTARTNDDPTSDESVWGTTGYRALLTDADLVGMNFRFLNLNQTYNDLIEVDLKNKATAALQGGKYFVHWEELDADVFISVPVLKIHDTGITNALKLQIGTAPGCYYGYNKMKGTSYSDGLTHDLGRRRWTTEEIVDLCQVANVDFVVVDALMTLQSYKNLKDPNQQVRMNTIVAGVDPVAIDNVCARLFCLNPDDIAHLTLAAKMGIGTNNPEQIEVVGNTIDDTKRRVKKNQTENGKFGQSNRTWILSEAFDGTDIDEEFIANEASLVPVPGTNNWTEPVYFFDDRIDLSSFYSDKTGIITYAFSLFSAPEAQTAEMWLGTHEAMKIYLNGNEVFKSTTTNTYSEDQNTIVTDKISVDLLKGENTLLVKTLNKFGDYSFALNICEPETNTLYAGNRVYGLKFYIKTQNIIDPPQDTTGIAQNTLPLIKLTAAPVPATFRTKIQFVLPQSANTILTIYDMAGKQIIQNNYGLLSSGVHSFMWDLNSQTQSKVPAGVYNCIITSGKSKNHIKLVVSE